MASVIRILYSQDKVKGVDEKLISHLANYVNGLSPSPRQFLGEASSFRLSFPEDFSLLKITPEHWRSWKDELAKVKERDSWDFKLLCGMKILATLEVKISESGIEMDMSSNREFLSRADLPETKRF